MKDLIESLKRAGWAPTLVFVAHLLFASGIDVYEMWPPLDLPMHLIGGVAIAYFLWTAYSIGIRSGHLGRPNRRTLALLTWTSTAACALFWEFAEFLSDRYLGTTTQTGLGDTLLDGLFGVVGGSIFVGLAWLRGGGDDPPP